MPTPPAFNTKKKIQKLKINLTTLFHPSFSFHATIDRRSNNNLDHIEEFETYRAPSDATKLSENAGSSSTPLPPILISGLPPVPAKLVKKAQDGLFIEMADLLPQKLISAEYYTEGNTTSPKQKHHEGANIIQ